LLARGRPLYALPSRRALLAERVERRPLAGKTAPRPPASWPAPPASPLAGPASPALRARVARRDDSAAALREL